MPKNKTHSGAKKRFKITGTGKVKHASANDVHKFDEKTSSRKRRVGRPDILSKPDSKKVKKMLGQG